MPRARYNPNSDFPFHITGRCINKDWFSMPLQEVWKIMSDQLYFLHHAFEFEILAFVLMSNHFHLMVRTPQANLAEGMAYFMRETSRSIIKDSERINQTYGSRYGRCLIHSNHHLMNAYKYIYHNPVRAGICDRVELYPFSTLPGLIGKHSLSIPIQYDSILFSDLNQTLQWLNVKPQPDLWMDLNRAMKKSQFKLLKVNKEAHFLESHLI